MVKRKESGRSGDNIVSKMTVSAKQRRFDLLEKKYSVDKAELNAYSFLSRHIKSIPRVFSIEPARNIVLIEDIEPNCVSGFDYDEDNVNGIFFRQNYQNIMTELAKWHAAFWENKEAFSQIGLDWRWTSKESLLAHIGLMQKDFETYKCNELHGNIPHEWHSMENHIDAKKMGCFEQAINILKTEYVKLLEERFYTGKNITVIHGDLNPSTVNITWADKQIKFDGLQAVRMGLGTEDLAMLIALHIEPDMKKAKEMLDYYYQALCESVDGYSYETFINDYKLAVMENMFFVIKLMNRGIYDFVMRDKAITAFKSISWV